MLGLKKWIRRHKRPIIGWTATAIVLIVWLFLMDWIVMPIYTHNGQEEELPDITEQPFEYAQEILESKGFKIIKDREKYDSNYPKGMIITQNPEPYAKVKKGRRIYVTVSSGEKSVVVPNLVGSSERDASFILNRSGLILGKVSTVFNEYYPQGVVCEQSIPKDTEAEAKTVLDITVSRGVMPSRFVVPDLIGKNIETAKKLLWEAGLEVGRIENRLEPNLIPGTVILQTVTPRSEVELGRAVGLTISRVE